MRRTRRSGDGILMRVTLERTLVDMGLYKQTVFDATRKFDKITQTIVEMRDDMVTKLHADPVSVRVVVNFDSNGRARVYLEGSVS
jgi:hypothetical protein